jgi:hypothetical protein
MRYRSGHSTDDGLDTEQRSASLFSAGNRKADSDGVRAASQPAGGDGPFPAIWRFCSTSMLTPMASCQSP